MKQKKKDLSPNLVQLSYLQTIASFNLQVSKIPPTMLAKRHRYLLPGVLPATNGGTAAEAKLCVGGGVAGGPRSDPASDFFLGWLVPSVNFQ